MPSEPTRTPPLSLLPPPPAAPAPSWDHHAAPPPAAPHPRSALAAVCFHGAAAVLTTIAAAAALVAYVLAAWASSTCNDEAYEPEALANLRLSIIVIGFLFAVVPGAWALIGRAARFHWLGWAAIAAMGPVTAMATAMGTHDVGTWCLY